MNPPISELDSNGLIELVRERELDGPEVLQVLCSPYCTVQVAEMVASHPRLMDSHAVRERLASFPGFTFARAMDLIGTLPWTSLLSLAQQPRTPPVIRRQSECKLLLQLPSMTLGEKIALARRTHRALLRVLIASGDGQVLTALLDNPRLVENDILVILNTTEPPPEFFADLARHHRWGQYQEVRRALVACPHTPLPLALSVLVQLPPGELRRLLEHPATPERVRDAAMALQERETLGLRRVARADDSSANITQNEVIRSLSDDGDGGAAQPPENFR